MKALETSREQIHNDIDFHAQVQIDLMEVDHQETIDEFWQRSTELIEANKSIIDKHYGTRE
jgi:hypothetical protein